MKQKKYLTIEEKREYLLKNEEIPISFNPENCFKKKSDRKYISTLITSGDSSLIVKVKKGSRIMVGSGEHAIFVRAGDTQQRSKKRLKILSLLKKYR